MDQNHVCAELKVERRGGVGLRGFDEAGNHPLQFIQPPAQPASGEVAALPSSLADHWGDHKPRHAPSLTSKTQLASAVTSGATVSSVQAAVSPTCWLSWMRISGGRPLRPCQLSCQCGGAAGSSSPEYEIARAGET